MKKLLIILILWFSHSMAFARMSNQSLEKARTLAMKITYSAYVKAPHYKRQMIEQLYRKLGEVRFNLPDIGYDFSSCSPLTLAYVEMYNDENTINLCYFSLIGTTEKLAQTIIHESAHLIGYEEECEASKIELLIYRLSQRQLVYRNNYLGKCGLDESLRWFF